jgi:hypothetical protein
MNENDTTLPPLSAFNRVFNYVNVKVLDTEIKT